MTDSFFPEPKPARPVWLVTLADLALLLVGFFVLVQANQTIDKRALAKGLREGFGISAPADEPMPVASAPPIIFATGSSEIATLPDAVTEWARAATRDPNVTLKITASVDGSDADVEAVTRSGAVLAADRARAVAAGLAGVVPAGRIAIATASAPTPGSRVAMITLGFGGARP